MPSSPNIKLWSGLVSRSSGSHSHPATSLPYMFSHLASHITLISLGGVKDDVESDVADVIFDTRCIFNLNRCD